MFSELALATMVTHSHKKINLAGADTSANLHQTEMLNVNLKHERRDVVTWRMILWK